MTVAEFLRHVRRMVVGFVVSRLLQGDGGASGELDEATTYYLLHAQRLRSGLGPCRGLHFSTRCRATCRTPTSPGRLDLAWSRGQRATPEDDDEGGEETATSGGEALARGKPWYQRRSRDLGEPGAAGDPPPLIDCVHQSDAALEDR